MGLFDDDFYSTKVSRRARSSHRKDDRLFSNRRGSRNWSNVRIAFISSFTSAVAAVLLFSVFFGGGHNGGGTGTSATAAATVAASDSLEQRTIQASAKVRPAVVSVVNEQRFPYGFGSVPEDGVDGGDGAGDADDSKGNKGSGNEGTLQEAGVGSGVIFKKQDGKAYIITNYHVVVGAESVKAILVNGERREARVVGEDQITDLAVLEIDAKGIDVVAEIGDSSGLHAGEFVIAIGNPLGLGDSLSMGIVSKTRQIVPVSLNQDGVYDWEQEVIQVDASINQGNSGGPLIDLNGRVVGINSMKIADIGVEGLGFAIPINNAMPVIDSLLAKGYVPRPYLGVYTMDLEQYFAQQGSAGSEGGSDDAEGGSKAGEQPALKLPDEILSGVIVLEAVGPAKDAGLKFNDVITKLDKQSIGSTMELRKYLYGKKKIGDEIEITYYRDGKVKTTKFKLSEKTNEDD
ncbi:S1C family serine protease [Paenibacillus gorillae]|uniref:S1C family serine protease n=1 Tax=Paenibacillus gorillae TaxID=1243662 RepID=UPI0004BB8FF5|nr:trypsin-like peptidase domain-containing protein [Paenibacillus gorillae]